MLTAQSRTGNGSFTGESAGNPLVSVLVPLYNHERYVGQCLESIIADGYPNMEILIVDDGSSDASLEVARAWHAAHAHSFAGRFEIRSRENRGVTKTLNELVARAQGDFVIVLASDDYLLPGGISSRLEYLVTHPGKMAVIGDCIVIDQDNVKLHDSGLEGYHRGRKLYLADEALINYEIVFHWCIPGPVFMARRELYRLVGGYNEHLAVEDWDFYLRLAARNLLGFIDRPVAAYRVHSRSYCKDPSRTISYNESMLKTVTDNLGCFTGVRRVYLFAEKLKLLGVIARLKKRDRFRGFLARKAGRLLLSVMKRLYDLAAPRLRNTAN